MFKSWTSSLLAVSVGLATSLSAIAQDSIDYKEQEKLHEIAGAMQADRIESDIQTLVDFGTRHTLSETESDTRGIGAARRWIFAEFERISEACGGCLEVMYGQRHYFGRRAHTRPCGSEKCHCGSAWQNRP